jgi:hypothetical protein
VPATPVIPPAPLFVPAAPLFVPAAPLFAPDPELPFPAAPDVVELPEVLHASANKVMAIEAVRIDPEFNMSRRPSFHPCRLLPPSRHPHRSEDCSRLRCHRT